jgi:drug/metabolite transporter (DMT)-like permease
MLVFLGMAGYYGSTLLDFLGLQYISVGLERLILYTYPTLTLLIAFFLYRRVPSGWEIVALSLTYFGIGLAFLHDLRWQGDNVEILLGASLVFAASLTYAVYLTGSAPLIQRLGSRRFTALCMLVSSFGALAHFLMDAFLRSVFTAERGDFLVHATAKLALPWQVIGIALAMAFFTTVLPVFMLSAAISRIGTARTVLIGSAGPVLTIFLGWLWLDETLSVAQLIGTSCVLTGVLFVSLPKRPDESGMVKASI